MKNRISSLNGKTLFATVGLEDFRQVLEAAVAVGAELKTAQLQNAHLPDANLQKGNLVAANFNGANLCGADLSFADVRGATFKGARFDCMTRFEGLIFEGGELEGMIFVRIRGSDLIAL